MPRLRTVESRHPLAPQFKTLAQVEALLEESIQVGNHFTRVSSVRLSRPDLYHVGDIYGAMTWVAGCDDGSLYARGFLNGPLDMTVDSVLQRGFALSFRPQPAYRPARYS